MKLKEHTCCFLGHRKVNATEELLIRLKNLIESLITDKKVDTFLFGSKSEFDKLCLKIVTELKKNKHPQIKRVYVRAEFPYIDETYKTYLLESYDQTFYPEKLINSGKAAYVERNCEMIDNSSYCVIYFDEGYIPKERKSSKKDLSNYQPKSGTKLAYDYAEKRGVSIMNVFEK